MKANFQKYICLCRLTRDPERIEFQNGGAVTKFGIAVNNRVKRGDDWEEEPLFLDCQVFNRGNYVQADWADEWLKKGDPVHIEGHFVMETWKDKDTGANRSKIVLNIDAFQSLTSRDDDSPRRGRDDRDDDDRGRGRDDRDRGSRRDDRGRGRDDRQRNNRRDRDERSGGSYRDDRSRGRDDRDRGRDDDRGSRRRDDDRDRPARSYDDDDRYDEPPKKPASKAPVKDDKDFEPTGGDEEVPF
jgi:single-strand DNA-binding protein